MRILSLWSGPRNVSTALMYSFLQHPAIHVIDEPLYAHYLSKTSVSHPGDKEVLLTMEHDGEKVLKKIVSETKKFQIVFLKNMAHHWIGLDSSWLDKYDNIFLIRDPKQMLPSLVNQLPKPILRDTGLKTQVEIYDRLQKQGKQPIIIDAKYLLKNPKKILRIVFKHLGLPFSTRMLKWPKGPKREDGIWAKYWYHNVHQSEEFTPYYAKKEPFPEHLNELLDECTPYYQYLTKRSIKTD